MKTHKFFRFLTLAFCAIAFAFVTCCEGPEVPQGPAGADGADGTNGTNGTDGVDGVDANETCKECHNESTLTLNAKVQQFEAGGHSMGTYYSRGGECAGCHNNEGFLARIDHTQASDIYTFDGTPETQISCYTCHSIHQAYTTDDWGLTLASQVTETILGTKSTELPSISFKDYESSNMCLQCQQSRDSGGFPGAVPTEATYDITSSHWGPHYGVQGNVLHSSGGSNVVGSSNYPAEGLGHAGAIADVSCMDCHMVDGDHSLEVNLSACVECHGDEDTAEGKLEDLHTEIHDMMFELGDLLATAGVMTVNYEDDGTTVAGYSPKPTDAVDPVLAQSVWNYMVAYQDHSYGAHNPAYMTALLENSLEAVKALP